MNLYKKKSLLENLTHGLRGITSFGSLRANNYSRMSAKEVDQLSNSLSSINTSWSGESSSIIPSIRAFYDSKSNLITEYDRLDPSDSVVSAVLDQYADSTVVIPAGSFENSPFTLTGNKKSIKKIQDLFDSLNLTSEMWTWARQLCKIGEIFLVVTENDKKEVSVRLEINPRKYMRLRLEEVSAIFDTEYGCFVDNHLLDKDNIASEEYAKLLRVNKVRVIPIQLSTRTDICRKVEITLSGNRRVTVEHLTGSSILDPVLITTRILRMIEDTLIMTRIEKSKLTRIYHIEVGSKTPDAKVKQMVAKTRKLLSGRETMSTLTDSFEKSSVSKVLNEVIVPTMDGKGAINIEDVNSVFNAGDMEDLKYFQTKFYAGVKIPKIYLGHEEDTPSGLGGNPLTKVESRYGRSIRRIALSLENGMQDLVNAILSFNEFGGIKSAMESKVTINLFVDKTDEEMNAVANLRDMADGIRSVMDVVKLDSRLNQAESVKSVIKMYSTQLYQAMYVDDEGNEKELGVLENPTNDRF